MNKPEIVKAWCEQRVGCPYIYGGTGKPCTPEYREARMKQYPAYAEKIKRNCPRLSGAATTCRDCRWCDPETGVGKQAYDCAQLAKYAMEAAGIPMVSGANSQWERTDWQERGAISDLPFALWENVFLVFRWDADKGKMGHVGVYQGDGTVIHAKGHDVGVVRQRLQDTNFTHYGIPKGLYDGKAYRPVLRQGDTGPDVLYLQTLLSSVGDPIDADGAFGPKTAAAVKAFQKAHGLTVDGVVGPKTWTALESATGHDEEAPDDFAPPAEDEPAPEPPDGDAPIIPAPAPGETVTIQKTDWDAIRAAVSILRQTVKKYEIVG